MDTCVHSMEYEADVCPEGLKDVKERVNKSRFQLRLEANSRISDKHYQLS